MMTTLVDSNVLLDVATNDRRWGGWSGAALQSAADEGVLVINSIIYSEVSVGYPRIEELEDVLPRALLRRDPIPYEAAFLAGKCFLAYRRRGGAARSPLPDFFVGAHAVVSGFRLLTRDVARYRTYFPKVELISP